MYKSISTSSLNPPRVRIARRLEFRLSILGPIVNCLKIPALLRHCKVCIKSLLLLIPPDRHDTDVGVAEERLPQVVKAVLVVPVAQMLRVSWVVDGSGHVEELLTDAIL